MRSRPRYNEAYAPLPARHVAAVLGREPASAGGLNETRPRGQVEGPAGASLWDVHAPAASLGRGPAPTLGDGRPATVLPRAQNKMVRAAIPSLPRPCPVTPPKVGGVVFTQSKPILSLLSVRYLRSPVHPAGIIALSGSNIRRFDPRKRSQCAVLPHDFDCR